MFLSKQDLYNRFLPIVDKKMRCLNNLVLLRQRIFNTLVYKEDYNTTNFIIKDIEPINLGLILASRTKTELIKTPNELKEFVKKHKFTSLISTTVIIELWKEYKKEFIALHEASLKVEEEEKKQIDHFNTYYKGKKIELTIFFNPNSSRFISLKKKLAMRENITVEVEIEKLIYNTSSTTFSSKDFHTSLEKNFPSLLINASNSKNYIQLGNSFIPLKGFEGKIYTSVINNHNTNKQLLDSLIKIREFNLRQLKQKQKLIILPLVLRFPMLFTRDGYKWDWEIKNELDF